MSALLGCPWCGGPAVMTVSGMIHCNRVSSACIGAKLHFLPDGTREETIAAWNTRATPAPDVGDGRDAQDATRWREFCRQADKGEFPTALLVDAYHMGAGVLDMHIDAALAQGARP